MGHLKGRHFQDGEVCVVSWDLLPLTYRPKLKFQSTAITKIWEAMENVQIGVVWGTADTANV